MASQPVLLLPARRWTPVRHGPYYLSSLVTFFGPAELVSGASSRSQRRRTAATGPRALSPIDVGVDTHVTALLTHASGVISTVTMSFEVWATRVPLFEVYGTGGTIAVADPNTLDGVTSVATAGEREFTEVRPLAGQTGRSATTCSR
ncbi:Gfo/Idh/MocA family protein [Tessaracoccus flavescens]|uniref:Gfo/Idh/MocA family protein n=1 Tax=Tessaracoccus flavescens TaxID=399497 RepID=UPI001F232AF6|nr:hypothetical protein [Tessaracoccus flavescens]